MNGERRVTVYETWVPPTQEDMALAWVLLLALFAAGVVLGVLTMGLRGGRR